MSNKYYAVAKGRKTGIFNTWSKCQQQINHFSGSKYHGFKTLQEAKDYLQSYRDNNLWQEVKKIDNYDYIIYTDGGFRKSCNLGAYAWTYSSKNQEMNNYYCHAVPKVTNQKMELTALYSALKHHQELKDHKLVIVSDSRYLVNMFTCQWIQRWAKNNWKRDHQHDVKNVAIIKPLYELARQFKDLSFQWVKGHANNAGNNRVDLLVNQAMDKYLGDKK